MGINEYWFRYYVWMKRRWLNFRYLPGSTRKITKNLYLAGLQAMIWTTNTPNKKHDCYAFCRDLWSSQRDCIHCSYIKCILIRWEIRKAHSLHNLASGSKTKNLCSILRRIVQRKWCCELLEIVTTLLCVCQML